MEFDFNAEKLFKCDKDGIGIIQGDNISKNNITDISVVLDSVGNLSAKAQGLKATITTATKFLGTNHRIYIKCRGEEVIGFIKTGVKKLFIRDELGKISEISPVCVLDFYVFETQQRSGFGKALFEKMLEFENLEPRLFGYDRPSEKLLSFLSKYYGLNNYVPQNNNFVVYKAYFLNDTSGNSNRNKTPNKRDGTLYNNNIKELTSENLNRKANIFSNKSSNKQFVKNTSNKNENLDLEEMNEQFNKININSDIPVKRNNRKLNDDENQNQTQYSNKITVTSNRKVTPWATLCSKANDTYLPSSSSYGAYYNFGKK